MSMDEEIRFLLNLQLLADEIEESVPGLRFYAGKDEQCLEGICFYLPEWNCPPGTPALSERKN